MKRLPKHVYWRRRLTVLAGVILLVLSVFGVIRDIRTPDYVCDSDVVYVAPGDSIWGIAERHCSGKPGYVGQVVHRIIQMNDGETTVHPGQAVRLP